MKLKHLFGILVVLLFIIGALVIKITIEQRSVLLFVTEGIILFSILFLFFFYRRVIRPFDSIANGMDLLREQDFGSRLSTVGQKETDRIVHVFNRMMGQLKEERLHVREQNHFLDLLIEESPMGVIVLDYDGHITLINRAAVRFLNIASSKDADRKILEQIGTPLADAIATIPHGKSQTVRLSDARIYRCSRLSFMDRGASHPFILIESLTSEVVKAEKKAYEKVIRMIAHEVNNTVGGITSSLETVKDMLDEVQDSSDIKEVMTVCIERSMGMSRFITKFADVVKIPEPQMVKTPLNDIVHSCKLFVESLHGDMDISFHYELSENSPEVNVDHVLFEQVIVNIVKNAVESITEKGSITIRTSDNPPMLEIIDDGEPITKETETKLFSPFFSTKPTGQGIGLLFIREVLDRHECTFSLRTYDDGLTRFRICFKQR